MCFPNAHGRLQLWDYKEKELITTVQRGEGNAVSQLRYNHNASLIAVGYADGQLTLCDALSLESLLKAPFHYAKTAIQFIEFSPNSTYLATAVRIIRFVRFLVISCFVWEEDFTVSVYRQNVSSADRYVFLGRHRGHYKPIKALFFGFTSDDNQPILTSIGEQNRFVLR